MKRKLIALLAASLLAPAFAADTENAPVNAGAEFAVYVDPLKGVADRLVAAMPDGGDPQRRAEMYRFMFTEISHAYYGLLYADPEHPDLWPLFSQVFDAFFPNPDDIYQFTPLDPKGVYRLSGYRGTTRIIDFQIADAKMFGDGAPLGLGPTLASYSIDKLHLGKNGSFDVMLSAERPAGYKGDWWKLDDKANYMVIRQISYDWEKEIDARIAIDRLDRPVSRGRMSREKTDEQLRKISGWVENWITFSMNFYKRAHSQLGDNKFLVRDYSGSGGVGGQFYPEMIYNLADDEALIVETEIPRQCGYWNFQIADDWWRTTDPARRIASINGLQAKLSKDGKFRAVLSAKDPGVPNWFDTFGIGKGMLYGRWTRCSSAPTPTVTKVKLDEVKQHMPADTPNVSPEQRDRELRAYKRAFQLRRRT